MSADQSLLRQQWDTLALAFEARGQQQSLLRPLRAAPNNSCAAQRGPLPSLSAPRRSSAGSESPLLRLRPTPASRYAQARAGALWDALSEREAALWAEGDKERESSRQRMAAVEGALDPCLAVSLSPSGLRPSCAADTRRTGGEKGAQQRSFDVPSRAAACHCFFLKPHAGVPPLVRAEHSHVLREEIARESLEVRAAVARTKQEAEGLLRKSAEAVAQLRTTLTARCACGLGVVVLSSTWQMWVAAAVSRLLPQRTTRSSDQSPGPRRCDAIMATAQASAEQAAALITSSNQHRVRLEGARQA